MMRVNPIIENVEILMIGKMSTETNAMIRPDWDEYFLALSKLVSIRSNDLFNKHGAVIVDKFHRILSTGFNGTIRGETNLVDQNNRDERRQYMIHAEENAILNCRVDILGLGESTIYVSGWSCNPCLQKIIQCGITRVVELDILCSAYPNWIDEDVRRNLLNNSTLIVDRIDVSRLPNFSI